MKPKDTRYIPTGKAETFTDLMTPNGNKLGIRVYGEDETDADVRIRLQAYLQKEHAVLQTKI